MCYQSDLADIQPQIKSYISSRVFNKSDVSDLVQEVNKILIEKEPQFQKSGNFKGWVMTIARYQIMGYLTDKKRKRPPVSLDENPSLQPTIKEESEWLSDIPFRELVEKEIESIKSKILSILTEPQIKVFNLLCLGMSISEIAEELDMTYGNVTAQKRRLIKRAKKHLQSLSETNKYDYRSNR